MLKFKATNLDGEELEFKFEDIGTVFKEDGVFLLTNQPLGATVSCKIESVKVIGED